MTIYEGYVLETHAGQGCISAPWLFSQTKEEAIKDSGTPDELSVCGLVHGSAARCTKGL